MTVASNIMEHATYISHVSPQWYQVIYIPSPFYSVEQKWNYPWNNCKNLHYYDQMNLLKRILWEAVVCFITVQSFQKVRDSVKVPVNSAIWMRYSIDFKCSSSLTVQNIKHKITILDTCGHKMAFYFNADIISTLCWTSYLVRGVQGT